MIEQIALRNFKCFGEKKIIPLSPITILYGKNGRGKSTVVQSLLLLAQTMQKYNDIKSLLLIGRLIELGTFRDVIYNGFIEDNFEISLKNGVETVEMCFSQYPDKIQLAEIVSLVVNGVSRMDEMGDDISGDVNDSVKAMSTTSDIMLLQQLATLRYVTADRVGPTNDSQRNDALDSDWMGVDGTYVINVLASQGAEFQIKVCEALSEILDGASLSVKSNEDSGRIELFLNSMNGTNTFRPKNVGFGYSYILPVIVDALLLKEGGIFIVENPEAHLHPAAQSRLMKFLIDIAKNKNVQLIVESHSDHVVNGLRIAMKQKYKGLEPVDAEVLFFSHETSSVEPTVEIIHCDKNGELDIYPDDFMDEWTKQLVQLI